MSDTEKQLLGDLVDRAAYNLRYGSFSQRNPLLGRKTKCPYCRRRRFENAALPCCSSRLIPGTENEKVHTKGRKNPRLAPNYPLPYRLIHQRLVELEHKPGFVEHEGTVGIVEAAVVRERKEDARQKRNQQKLSRRINATSV